MLTLCGAPPTGGRSPSGGSTWRGLTATPRSSGQNEEDHVQLKPGQRLASAVCSTEVVVVKAPASDVDLWCGGHAMVLKGEAGEGGQLDDDYREGTLIGKRYADESIGIEVLCTKAGDGSLSIGVTPLLQKDAKALPSSD